MGKIHIHSGEFRNRLHLGEVAHEACSARQGLLRAAVECAQECFQCVRHGGRLIEVDVMTSGRDLDESCMCELTRECDCTRLRAEWTLLSPHYQRRAANLPQLGPGARGYAEPTWIELEAPSVLSLSSYRLSRDVGPERFVDVIGARYEAVALDGLIVAAIAATQRQGEPSDATRPLATAAGRIDQDERACLRVA